ARSVSLFLDLFAAYVAFHRPRSRAGDGDLLLRHHSARILREGAGAWIRVVQANERGDDAPITTGAGPADRGDEKNGGKEIISRHAALCFHKFFERQYRHRRMLASRRNFKLSIRKRAVIYVQARQN